MTTRTLVVAVIVCLTAFITEPRRGTAAEPAAPAADIGTVDVMEVTGLDGLVAYSTLSHENLGVFRAKLEKGYSEAIKAWKEAKAEAARENDGKIFDQPEPQRPRLKLIHTKLSADDAGKLVAELREAQRQIKGKTYYRSLCGKIMNRHGPIPYAFMAVPDGNNLLTESVLARLRGHVDMDLREYEGTGRLTIPSTGVYRITCSQSLYLNGLLIGGFLRDAATKLDAGTYDVRLTCGNNGGQLPTTTLKIVQDSSGKVVPVYNSQLDIEAFLANPINGSVPKELSGWRPSRENLVVLPATPEKK
ncbi:MAG: hypothetical protein K8S99_08515 [Planctomycetes bacterium]|nr:hypothetical protein [Planctomycetota bacterium]